MKKNIEIIIGVIASRSTFYDNLVKEYWQFIINYTNNNYQDKVKIYLMYGNEFDENYFNYLDKKDVFVCNYEDSQRPGILKKTIDFMKYIEYNYNYKQLFRTNLSSFLVLDNMFNICKKLDISNNYSGSIIYNNIINWDKILKNYVKNYVSGCGFWLSNDLVKYIIKNEEKINYNKFDDVEIAKILENICLPSPYPRLDIVRYNSWKSGMSRINVKNNKIQNLNKIYHKIINFFVKKKKHYHIRIKIAQNNVDLFFIKKLTNFFYK